MYRMRGSFFSSWGLSGYFGGLAASSLMVVKDLASVAAAIGVEKKTIEQV